VKLSGSTPNRRGAPLLGEHTRDVLREGGLTDTEIEALERSGVARAAG
jgi:crotonobetainyl-CoA:carnitine CoA-transferase CaiB-like acyl-CoA transferase